MRQKEPLALLVSKGKKHLTKAEKEEREKTEIHAPADKIVPPDFLTEKEKKRFSEISGDLVALGIMANLDTAALARYVTAETAYERLTRALRRCYTTDMDGLAKTLKAQDTLFKQCRAAASDLGLTITSRCRLVVPKPEEKPANRFDGFNDQEEGENDGTG